MQEYNSHIVEQLDAQGGVDNALTATHAEVNTKPSVTQNITYTTKVEHTTAANTEIYVPIVRLKSDLIKAVTNIQLRKSDGALLGSDFITYTTKYDSGDIAYVQFTAAGVIPVDTVLSFTVLG